MIRQDESLLTYKRSTRSIYNEYLADSGNGTREANNGHFEKKIVFRDGLSRYVISTGAMEAGTFSKWDPKNYGGAPMDYDASTGILYVDGSDSHTLLIGATGSKKSRLVVMPMIRILASAGEAMVVCDPKGEIYKRTSGFLQESGYKIRAISLREPTRGDGWNMLSVPYELYLQGQIDKACEFINDTTVNLIPISAKDPYWDYSARDMLFGLVMLLFKICRDEKIPFQSVNMRTLLKLRGELFGTVDSSSIMDSALWKFGEQDDLIRTRLRGVVGCPHNTMSCIISTFDQHMSCFSLQPQVSNMLSCSTFNLHDIGFGRDAVFLIMPDEKSTYHKIIAIFLKQMYELLIDNAFKMTDNNRFPVRVNFVLDEFSSLPQIPDMPQMITASRSRNIRFTLIVQSKHQLRQRYKEETETIMSNCANWMFLTSREIELLRELSDLGGIVASNNEPLISISRLQHLNKDEGECLILSGRKHPYLATLPDIDLYDQQQYVPRELSPRKDTVFGESIYSDPDYFQRLVMAASSPPITHSDSPWAES